MAIRPTASMRDPLCTTAPNAAKRYKPTFWCVSFVEVMGKIRKLIRIPLRNQRWLNAH